MMLALQILQDAFFAALAAVGFAAISNTPAGALKYCALIAALGHATRYVLMAVAGWHIVGASLAAAFMIGLLAIFLAPAAKVPPETFSYPSLLPMIPGIYAYKSVQSLVVALGAQSETAFDHYFYIFESNGLIALFVILSMVIGQMIPILLFRRLAFTATRD